MLNKAPIPPGKTLEEEGETFVKDCVPTPVPVYVMFITFVIKSTLPIEFPIPPAIVEKSLFVVFLTPPPIVCPL